MTTDEIIERLARDPGEPLRVPRATYRLQLGPEPTFDDAAEAADDIAALGISDACTSPFFETSGAGSHGYDVADHSRLRAEVGGEDAFARLADALTRLGLGLLVDVVPNHMGIARARNTWWQDVLEHGPASPHAAAFDIDWNPVKRELADKVLLPILGDPYGAVLDAGPLQLERRGGRFVMRHDDTVLPVGPRSYARILGVRLEELNRALGAEHPAALELKSILTLFATLPVRTETDPQRLAARRRETEAAAKRLDALLAESPDVRDFVDANVAVFNGTPGDPRSFDLLDAQVYRLAFWRVAGEEIDDRRFFDINELAAIRTEVPSVFAAAHRRLFRLVRDGIVTGLRIDHPDGLYRPAEYFRRLQRGALLEEIEAATDHRARARRLMKDPADGCVTLFVIRQALAVRRRHAELFARGDDKPVEVQGSRAEHICAFARPGPGGPTLVLPAEVHGPLRNAFTSARADPEGEGDERRLPGGAALADFPVALLEAA